MKRFAVEQEEQGERTDVFLASKYSKFTRSALSQLFDKKLVKINKKLAKASQRLKVGDEISVDEKLLLKKPPKLNLEVIYEDNNVIVINKPAGMLTHSKGALNLEATVASFIKPKLIDKQLTGNRAGIVHRLDRGTSGVIITAKDHTSLKWLQEQFSNRKVEKTYLAVVHGTPKPKQAIIDAPIARHPGKPQTFRVSAEGKPAQTKYRVIKSFDKTGGDYALVELRPLTGRTHQLRVHARYIGHPIVGDSVYGHDAPPIYLHARSLKLSLPTGKTAQFDINPPKIFEAFING